MWGSSWAAEKATLTVTAGVSLGRLCLLHAKEVALKAMSGEVPPTDDSCAKLWTQKA